MIKEVFTNVTTQGKTIEEAIENLKEAVGLYLEEMPELVKLIEAPEHIIKLSRELDYNRIMIVGLAINKPAPEQHWVYVLTPDTLFHRYAWISNYSPLNAPPNKSTLIAEITIPPNQPINTKKYIEETIHGLEKLEVIKNKDILFTRSWLHEYGYPIHTLVSNRARDEISRWLKEQGVTLIGRGLLAILEYG
ncbi:MAG: type II toxin-antitoxin system HicB family antitoxin [Candidatus Methanomethylicia archaeon]